MKQSDKSNETKRKVESAAERLFSQKGYELTTMQDIIELSGMSKGAIYHQYSSKQEILAALTKQAQLNVGAMFKSVNEDTSITAKEKILCIAKYFSNSETQKNLVNANWAEKIPFALLDTLRSTLKEYAPLLASILTQGINSKEFVCANPKLTAEYILLMMDIWLDPVIFHWSKEERNERFDFFIDSLTVMAPGLITVEDADNYRDAFFGDRP